MRTWTRATHTQRCGLCGTELRAGAAIVEYVFNVQRNLKLIRCAECEGGAPPDLPLVMERSAEPPRPLSFEPLSRIASVLPFVDFKQRAAERQEPEEERDPGEEG